MSEQRISRRAAATHAHRPGKMCRAALGAFIPVVHQPSCEADDACISACPYDVFEIRPIDPDDYGRLSRKNRLKVRFHGMSMAYTPDASDCRACGLCVIACPKDASARPGTGDGMNRLDDPAVRSTLDDLHERADANDKPVMERVVQTARERRVNSDSELSDILDAYVQIRPASGKLLHLLAAAHRAGRVVEFGPSTGCRPSTAPQLSNPTRLR